MRSRVTCSRDFLDKSLPACRPSIAIASDNSPQVKVLAGDQGNPILSAICAFRNRAYVVIQQILPEPQASLLSDILLGVDAGLPAEVQKDFRVTGTSHIIAISG